MEFLPFPKKDHGWLAGVFLAITFFSLYYATVPIWPLKSETSIYERLATAYRTEFYQSRTLTPECPEDELAEGTPCYDDYKVTVLVPQAVSTLVERELIVSVQNTGEQTFDLSLVVGFDLGNVPRASLVMGSEARRDASVDSNNVLVYDLIPPHATVTRQLFVKAILAEEPNDQIEALKAINFSFWPIVNQQQPSGQVKLRGSAQSDLDRGRALNQSFVRGLLLPPWSNGVLLFLAVLLPSFWEDLYGIMNGRIISRLIPSMLPGRNGRSVRWFIIILQTLFLFLLLTVFCLINGFFLQKTLVAVATDATMAYLWLGLWLIMTAMVVVVVGPYKKAKKRP